MDEREKEVIRAAHVLRNFCKKKDHCVDCPLVGSGCQHDRPEYWHPPELEDVPEEAPKGRRLVGIKTIVENVAERDRIDATVNKLLLEGWTLRKRELIVKPDHVCCDFIYIELERYEND